MMLPQEFTVGPVRLHAMGIAWCAGFVLAYWISRRACDRTGASRTTVAHAFVALALGAVLGARLYYVVTHLDAFRGHALSALTASSGTSSLGGVLGALTVCLIVLRPSRPSSAATLDAVAPGWAVMAVCGRLGCLAEGCCFGLRTHHSWGVRFGEGTPAYAAFGSHALIPTQLMEAAAAAGMGCLAYGLLRRMRPGVVFGLTVIVYGVTRALVGLWRFHDPAEPVLSAGPTSVPFATGASLAIVLVGVTWTALASRPPRAASAVVPPSRLASSTHGRRILLTQRRRMSP